jgi:hypothetical protein
VGTHYKVNLKYSFEDRATTSQTISSGTPGILGYYRQMTDLNFAYDWKKIGVETGYKRLEIDYTGNFKTSNYLDERITAVITAKPSFTPKTNYFFEYDYGELEYTKAASDVNNYKYHQFWIGVKGNITNKITTRAKIGKEFRFSYEHLNKYKDSFMVCLNLKYRHSEKLSFLLDFIRDDKPATNTGQGFNLGYRLFAHIVYDVNPKLKIDTGFDYWFDTYTTALEDNTYGYSAKMSYLVNRYTSLGLDYSYKMRDSTRADCKYRNNILLGKLKMVY